jgi:hypothetical protein
MKKKIVGYQVIGGVNTPHEDDIHPDMAGSFCIYSKKQCTTMIGNETDLWKILDIYEDDIEEPTFMF